MHSMHLNALFKIYKYILTLIAVVKESNLHKLHTLGLVVEFSGSSYTENILYAM